MMDFNSDNLPNRPTTLGCCESSPSTRKPFSPSSLRTLESSDKPLLIITTPLAAQPPSDENCTGSASTSINYARSASGDNVDFSINEDGISVDESMLSLEFLTTSCLENDGFDAREGQENNFVINSDERGVEHVPEEPTTVESLPSSSSTHNDIIEEAEKLLEEVCSVTVNVGKIVSEEVKEGLEQLTTPESDTEFGGGDVLAAVLTVLAFNCDLLSDILLARQLYLGDDLDKRWAIATICMTVIPLVTVNGFSLYWYWFDSQRSNQVGTSPMLSEDHLEKLMDRSSRDLNLQTKNNGKTIFENDGSKYYEIEESFCRELQASQENVGNIEISKLSESSSKFSLNKPSKITEGRIKPNTQMKSDNTNINYSGTNFINCNQKQILRKNETGSCYAIFHEKGSQPRKPNRVKRAVIWTLRILVHFALQANSLRQLDLLYYGTLSVVDKKRNWKGNCEDPAQVNGSLDSVLNKESGRTSAPSVLVAELHESKVEISASARQTFGSPKIDTMLTMDHGLHGNGQKKFYLSEDSTEEQKRYKELWLHAESDGAALDLLGAVLQDIPQIILQLYLLALSLPTLSASVLRYSSFFNAFHVDPWLFATVLDRIKLENSSNVVSDTDTALLAADEEAISKDANIIGNLKPMRRIAPTGSKLSGISDTSTTDSLPTNFESILTIPSLNKTSEAAALGLVAPEELLPETEKHLVTLQLLCLCGSLCAVSWSASSWVRAVRLASPRLTSLSPASLLLLTLSHLVAILPQVLCYAALAAASAWLLVLVLLVLWAAHTTWILSQLYRWSVQRRQLLEWFPHDVRTGWCRRADDVCVSAALALVFLLTFLDVSADEAVMQAAAHALLRLVLQTTVAATWWVSTGGVVWLQRGPLFLVISAAALHAALTAAYYSLLQRANKPRNIAATKGTGEEVLHEVHHDFSCTDIAGINEDESPPDTGRTQLVCLQNLHKVSRRSISDDSIDGDVGMTG